MVFSFLNIYIQPKLNSISPCIFTNIETITNNQSQKNILYPISGYIRGHLMLALAINLHRKSFNTQKINPGPPLLSIRYFQIARMTDTT